MLTLTVFLFIFYIIIGLTSTALADLIHYNLTDSKAIALVLFWPIISIKFICKFFKLAFKGLKEWFK